MNTEQIVQRLVDLSSEVVRKKPILDEEHGTELGIVLFGDEEDDRRREGLFQAHASVRSKFDRFLDRIPPEQIEKIQTLMYFGRDAEGNDMRLVHDQEFRGHEEAYRSVKEKLAALPLYLTRAVARAAELGIDVNGPLF